MLHPIPVRCPVCGRNPDLRTRPNPPAAKRSAIFRRVRTRAARYTPLGRLPSFALPADTGPRFRPIIRTSVSRCTSSRCRRPRLNDDPTGHNTLDAKTGNKNPSKGFPLRLSALIANESPALLFRLALRRRSPPPASCPYATCYRSPVRPLWREGTIRQRLARAKQDNPAEAFACVFPSDAPFRRRVSPCRTRNPRRPGARLTIRPDAPARTRRGKPRPKQSPKTDRAEKTKRYCTSDVPKKTCSRAIRTPPEAPREDRRAIPTHVPRSRKTETRK